MTTVGKTALLLLFAFVLLLLAIPLCACDAQSYLEEQIEKQEAQTAAEEEPVQEQEMNVKIDTENLHEIYFAGGCFWGVEEYFSRIPGVADAVSGFANGKESFPHPAYELVCTGVTDYAETVHVTYDPNVVSLETLTRQFFKIIDPTSLNKQGNDRGSQYRSGVYYVDEADLPTLQAVFDEVQQEYDKEIVTELEPLTTWSEAEEYHQDYLQKNPNGYCHIDFSTLDDVELETGSEDADAENSSSEASADDAAVDGEPYGYEDESGVVHVNEAAFSRPTDEEIKELLNDEQYRITQEDGTEGAFTGDYHDNKEAGIYVDVLTGEPLFSSADKYNSGCGWPSFTRPIDPDVIVMRTDTSHGLLRTEVRSRVGDCHLGHVFTDGPIQAGGYRYCIDSAALEFIPYEDMESRGYGIFMPACETYSGNVF